MKLTICLAKTTVIFYSLLAPFIIVGSLYNLVKGVFANQNAVVYIGAFSLFGFILLPILIVTTYIKNKCVIQSNSVCIGKVEFSPKDYRFEIQEKLLAFKDRPIFSLLRKKYYLLIIKKIETGTVVLEKDLDVFQNDIEKIKLALPRVN
jgi:hypothetical protein